ncbi:MULTISPECIES: ATP-dependent helicase HrpB [unclassified Paenibacillus]|uniref:ATP-dependent helicase HrpB n=1 Tax=unclassified Paenibacillus TaxID=185978 RepID=UPI0009A690EB|nr:MULTISPECIES: ATP-dependent helicase HrpB [unclassified Paenibacillus]SLJ97038.1 ATP-dependent helicase HrpB [Paenibacillus sp. RU5A]SOC67012.1 ATP-dependent helicase HrpB [Paenibacillus sp. RU26A]SOC69839.1 ATP-dependent helicase HrpB [Paenibacillus sp. RU5M]
MKTDLPIQQIIPELRQLFQEKDTGVLIAEPGAGKTTVVPLALLEEPWVTGRKIIMLEPRRLAARSAAARMAASLGEKAGQTVGYRVRMDTRVSQSTRIEVVTEGVLTRMLQQDQGLEDTAMIIFDEFHERHLHGDLGLALALESRAMLRPDLKLLVMSATLDPVPVCALLGEGTKWIACPGRTFPVETRYVSKPVSEQIETFTAQAVVRALLEQEGDVLVFLPGAKEIHRTERELSNLILPAHVEVHALYGSMPVEGQDEAVRPADEGKRKVVLSTSIAESSLTLAGVKVVVDAGLSRASVFSPRTGMSRLVTLPVSKASADQRRGRAGRIAPGVCYRLWSEEAHGVLPEAAKPEIASADLAPLALELAAWGVQSPAELQWLDTPPAAAYGQAQALLRQLGGLDDAGRITPFGRRMNTLGVHPRLASMLLRAAELGLASYASMLAALLQEPAGLLSSGSAGAGTDLRPRVEALLTADSSGMPQAAASVADGAAVRRMLQESRQLRSALGPAADPVRPDEDSCGWLLSFAYPDRIGQRREDGRYLLSSGRGVRLAATESLSRSAYLVAAEADDQGADARILLAAPVQEKRLLDFGPHLLHEEVQVAWDRNTRSVRAHRRLQIGAITLKENSIAQPPEDQVLEALLSGIRIEGLDCLPWTKSSRQLADRMRFLHHHLPEWPDLIEDHLTEELAEHLSPFLTGMRSAADLKRLSMQDVLLGGLSWEQRQQLDREAPTHIQVPSGSRIPVDYSRPEDPTLAVRLQEMFGQQETPRIGGGRVPLTIHLLSPAQRPVQVTRDLANFWRETYFEVKKDLKGRYPKHYWPDDPLEAIATNRAKPRV